MQHSLVSVLDAMASRMIAGVLNLTTFHPVLLCAILAVLAGAAGAVLLDVVVQIWRPQEETEGSIQLRRR